MSKELLYSAIVAILIIALCVISLTCLGKWKDSSTNEVWNNGFCRTCGNRFEPFGRTDTSTWYWCKSCGTEVSRSNLT